MQKLAPVLATLMLLAVLLAACGDDDDDDTTPPAATQGAETAQATPPPEQTEEVVDPTVETPAETPEATTEPSDDGAGAQNTIASNEFGLYVYRAADGSLEEFVDGEQLGLRADGLDWFPASDGVAAIGFSLLTVSTISGDNEVVVEPEQRPFGVAVSPDGETVAYGCGDAEIGLCLVSPTGEDASRIEDGGVPQLWLDDQLVLVTRGGGPANGEFFVVNTGDGTTRPATEAEIFDPNVSIPSLGWRFVVGEGEAFIMPARSDTIRIDIPIDQPFIEGFSTDFESLSVAWTVDDTYAAVVERLTDGSSGVGYRVWVVELQAGTVELAAVAEAFPDDLGSTIVADWSPDSTQLALLLGFVGD
jgi:hypothetical protein